MSKGRMGAVVGVLVMACAGHGAALAQQSSVQLYGLLDSGLLLEKQLDDSRKFGMASGIAGQSRFGIRGSEDLGNGYSVTFQMEGGLLTTTGTSTQGRLFGRQATLGIKGGFGELKFGRQTVFGYSWTPFIASPFGVAWSGNGIGSTFGYKSGDYGADGRLSNAVTYQTPVVGGLEAGIGYSFSTADEQSFGSSNNNRVLTAGLRYSNGPLKAALTYERLNPIKDSNNRKAQNLQFGLSYDFGVVRLFSGYNEQRNINLNPAPGYVKTGGDKDRAFTVGASIPTGKRGTAMLSYQRAMLSNNGGFAAGYRYQLSKRTNVYAMGNVYSVRNHFIDEKQCKHQLGVGLQHSF